MATIRLLDKDTAVLFSFSTACSTTQAAEEELVARGWSPVEAHLHVDAALSAGAYEKVVTKYPTRKERVTRNSAPIQQGDAQGEDN